MKRKSPLSLEGKGKNIFFDDDRELQQQNDLSTKQQNDKATYKQQNLKRVTFYVSPAIHKRIKMESTNRDMKVSEFVNEILNAYFSHDDKEA
jgi:predicted DNA binding CopG/RHH family protein